MWLTSSSVGRKFIMSLTGVCLVLFVTFHCLMNSVAILWPAAYNMVCEFLGANWYALIASMGLALLFVIHIIYALCLTVKNRRARGNDRYAINGAAPGVEWSSKNMLVLGIVVVAFLIVHLIQFWAKMQLVEVCGCHTEIPAAAGTLFIHEAFSQVWTPIVYVIGFVALWFHLNHGFWSMFQSIGWDNTKWIPRLKCIGKWWTSIVILLFLAQVAVFTINAKNGKYLKDEGLRDQYAAMQIKHFTDVFGEGAANQGISYTQLKQVTSQVVQMPGMVFAQVTAQNPDLDVKDLAERFANLGKFINFLEGEKAIDTASLEEIVKSGALPQNPMMQMMQPQQAPQPEPQAEEVSPEQQEADIAPAQDGATNEESTNN